MQGYRTVDQCIKNRFIGTLEVIPTSDCPGSPLNRHLVVHTDAPTELTDAVQVEARQKVPDHLIVSNALIWEIKPNMGALIDFVESNFSAASAAYVVKALDTQAAR